jgi:hypothetical protein
VTPSSVYKGTPALEWVWASTTATSGESLVGGCRANFKSLSCGFEGVALRENGVWVASVFSRDDRPIPPRARTLFVGVVLHRFRKFGSGGSLLRRVRSIITGR